MVIDARRSNRRFKDPPGVVLAGPEVFANLEVEGGQDWFMAEVDVDNFYHRLRIDDSLGRYFCFPPVSSRDFGLTDVSGDVFGP